MYKEKQGDKQMGDMAEPTEANLEAMLIEIRKHLDDTSDRVSLIPTQLIVRPSDLEALGLTVADVKKMIKEQNFEKLWEKNT